MEIRAQAPRCPRGDVCCSGLQLGARPLSPSAALGSF